ncbi:hypothetical protein [Brochothrix campestris]|uniref:Uncharacterized protein n=1 Tax=Brochothrix campestris FSL F6-1037 TaxID=1265861 RepID=W7CU75_9LIST|nr:hypothetical protein [Brochothrix campestris]EUJ39356.1 hypothetical protein BCAMP_07435 [Brochothrix campestris FSL F6-1037]
MTELIDEQVRNRKKRLKIVSIIGLVLLIAVSITMYQLLKDADNVEIIAGDFLPANKDATKAQKKAAASAKVDASNFTLSIYPEAVYSEGSAKAGSLQIRNDASNAYPINVKIRLDASGLVVYESGAIQPGYEVKNVPLDEKVTKGEYEATAEVDIFDPKTKEKQGSAQAGVSLSIKK